MPWHLTLSFLRSHRELKSWKCSFENQPLSYQFPTDVHSFLTGLSPTLMQQDEVVFHVSSVLLLRRNNAERPSEASSTQTSVNRVVKSHRSNSALPLSRDTVV